MALEFAVQWLHIIVSIFWFGGMLFTDFILTPGLRRMSPPAQREFGMNVASRVPSLMIPAAVASIALGVVRGTVLGDIRSVDELGTTYGLAWLASLVVGVVVLAWSVYVMPPAVARLQRAGPGAASVALAEVSRNARIQLAGFLVIFTLMIVMHYA